MLDFAATILAKSEVGMDVLLFRHGIAVERDEWEGAEAERPLTDKGSKRVHQAVAGLLWLDLAPTHIFTSPMIRAHETAKILQAVMRSRASIKIADELLPDAPPDKILPLLEVLPPNAQAICVGHEPHLSEAAGVLLFGKPVGGLTLKKAGACLIHIPDAVKLGRGQLQWWLTPGQLRKLG